VSATDFHGDNQGSIELDSHDVLLAEGAAPVPAARMMVRRTTDRAPLRDAVRA
jgi:hypothetical protein